MQRRRDLHDRRARQSPLRVVVWTLGALALVFLVLGVVSLSSTGPTPTNTATTNPGGPSNHSSSGSASAPAGTAAPVRSGWIYLTLGIALGVVAGLGTVSLRVGGSQVGPSKLPAPLSRPPEPESSEPSVLDDPLGHLL